MQLRTLSRLLLPALSLILPPSAVAETIPPLKTRSFKAEVRTFHTALQGFPADNVLTVVLGPDGRPYAGTGQGLVELRDGRWRIVAQLAGREVEALAVDRDRILVVARGAVYNLAAGAVRRVAELPEAVGRVNSLAAAGSLILIAADSGLYEIQGDTVQPVAGIRRFLGERPGVRQVVIGPDGEIAVAATTGVLTQNRAGVWTTQQPRSGAVSWAPFDVRGVCYDSRGRLWLASPQGVGCRDAEWVLYDADAVPYNDFTTLAAGEDGVVWLGTQIGAIRYDGRSWQYRQGLRWLPDDHVRSIAVDNAGTAWLATSKGLAEIKRHPMTLAAKARLFENEIDKRHRRTEYGYVSGVTLQRPGDTGQWTQHDTDNDGLWTAMYGAAECFAVGATGDAAARSRAKAAFEALRFLGEVTQGGRHSPPPGFVARTVLPATAPNPNLTGNTPERDRQLQTTRDKAWKVIAPRWPTSADGKWYWKSDTSSDELDGHYFFYPLYYDLVAVDEAERARVRKHVAGLTDHLIQHDFNLVDHDGRPTRWGVFDPRRLNADPAWREERGLNSLSILSYLKVAEHVTGDNRYREAAQSLIRQHAYDINVLIGKPNRGPGSGNQSDDEMAFMSFYSLLRYETDPRRRGIYGMALRQWWEMEKYELNPLFDFIAAVSLRGVVFEDPFGDERLDLTGSWLEDSVDTLVRYPLERINWRLTNSHRKDIVLLPEYAARSNGRPAGSRRDGRVLPIDERFVDHWNHDPWVLDQGGDGTYLADGASFLLPYYMGVYHGLIEE
jgi:hypothetical protein